MVTSANHKEIGGEQTTNNKDTTSEYPQGKCSFIFPVESSDVFGFCGKVKQSMQFADFGLGLEDLFEKY